MDCIYIAIECRIGARRTYGIAAVDREDCEKIILDSIIDVTDDRETAEVFANRCNRERVKLDQFKETVRKFIV